MFFKRILRHICIFYFIAFFNFTFLFAQNQPRGHVRSAPPIPQLSGQAIGYGKSWALIVAIDKYKDYPYLKTAVAGAKVFSKKLKDEFGFPASNIIELYNEQATKDSIEVYLKDFFVRKTKFNDRLLVYFGGHGDTYQGKIGYLCPYDAQKNRLPLTAISMNDIEELNQIIPAKHIFYVLDCCFSGMAAYTRGGIADLPPSEPNYYKKLLTRKARQILTAGQTDELASDVGPGGKYSPFTYFLLQGLESDQVKDKYHVIHASKLGQYVKENVEKLSGGKQRPIITRLPDSEQGDFLLWKENPKRQPFLPNLTFQNASGNLASLDMLIQYQNKKYGKKYFVVVFWDRYCVPCVHELKTLSTLTFPDVMMVVTINLDDPNKTSDFTLAKNMVANYPDFMNLFLTNISQKAELVEKLQFRGTPLTLLIDQKKNILVRRSGFDYNNPMGKMLLYSQIMGSVKGR